MKDCDPAVKLHINKLRKMWIEDYYDICSDVKPLSDSPREDFMGIGGEREVLADLRARQGQRLGDEVFDEGKR